MDAVIQNNVNPIEKVERSTLILASVVYDRKPEEMLKLSQRERVSTFSPSLWTGMELLEGKKVAN